MAKDKPRKSKERGNAPRKTFEESLAELQKVVADLESGETGLEQSMERFEQGIALLRSCYQILDRAEQRIEILTGTDADGNPVTEPFDASATAENTLKSAGKRKRTGTRARKDASAALADTDEHGDTTPDSRLF